MDSNQTFTKQIITKSSSKLLRSNCLAFFGSLFPRRPNLFGRIVRANSGGINFVQWEPNLPVKAGFKALNARNCPTALLIDELGAIQRLYKRYKFWFFASRPALVIKSKVQFDDFFGLNVPALNDLKSSKSYFLSI